MKLLWRIVFVLAAAALYIGYNHPDWIVDPASAISVANQSPPCTSGSYLIGYEHDGSTICHITPALASDPAQSINAVPAPTPQPLANNFAGK